MKHLWDFLAFLAGAVLTVFLVYELGEVVKTIISNAGDAFEIATAWQTVVGCIAFAVIATIVKTLIFRKNDR